MSLTDEQWALIQPFLPTPLPSPSQGEGLGVRARGRPPACERLVLDTILWKIRTATPWHDLPSGFPSWQTCYRRYRYWKRQGFLNAVFNALDRDLRDRGGLNFRAALAAQRIRFVPFGEQTQVMIDPALQAALQETWQIETLHLLLAVLFQAIRKKLPAHPLHLASPALLVPRLASLPQPTADLPPPLAC